MSHHSSHLSMEVYIAYPMHPFHYVRRLLFTAKKVKKSHPYWRKRHVVLELLGPDHGTMSIFRRAEDPVPLVRRPLSSVDIVTKGILEKSAAVVFQQEDRPEGAPLQKECVWGQTVLQVEMLSPGQPNERIEMACPSTRDRDTLYDWFTDFAYNQFLRELSTSDDIDPLPKSTLSRSSSKTLSEGIQKYIDDFLQGAEAVAERYASGTKTKELSLKKSPGNGVVEMLFDKGFKKKSISAIEELPGSILIATAMLGNRRFGLRHKRPLDLHLCSIEVDSMHKPYLFIIRRDPRGTFYRIHLKLPTIDLRDQWARWLVFIKGQGLNGRVQREEETFTYVRKLDRKAPEVEVTPMLTREVSDFSILSPPHRSLGFTEPQSEELNQKCTMPVAIEDFIVVADTVSGSLSDFEEELERMMRVKKSIMAVSPKLSLHPKIDLSMGLWCYIQHELQFRKVWLAIECNVIWVGSPTAEGEGLVTVEIVPKEEVTDIHLMQENSLGLRIEVKEGTREICIIAPTRKDRDWCLQHAKECGYTLKGILELPDISLRNRTRSLAHAPVEGAALLTDEDDSPLSSWRQRSVACSNVCPQCGENPIIVDLCKKTQQFHAIERERTNAASDISPSQLLRASIEALVRAREVLDVDLL